MQKYSVSLEPNGQSFDVQRGQKILDAALRQGVWIPNSCNQGSCGTCVVRVQAGQVDHNDSPLSTLPETDRDQSLALACRAEACTDLSLEQEGPVEDIGQVYPLRDFTGTVTGLEDVATDTRKLTIELDERLGFAPGQYVSLGVPGTGVSRHYSMANIPESCGTSNVIELHVKRELGGLCSDNWVFSTLAPDDRVELEGPLGNFRCHDQDTDGGVVMLAGGTGLAPIYSILQSILAEQPDREVHLYFSVRTEAELYDRDLMEDLSARYPNFHFKPCLTRQQWDGRMGYATDLIPEEFATLRGWSGYVCGPPTMVTAGRRAFKRRRMSPRRIHYEEFLPARQASLASAPVGVGS